MTIHCCTHRGDDGERQHVVIEVDVISGAYTEAVAERLLRTVVEEVLNTGAEATRVRVEIRGGMASW